MCVFQLYQTVCQTSYNGYGQSCGSQPVQQCYPETKCHRTPMTSCRPVQKDKCVKVPREALENRVEKTCLPFERSQAEIDAMVHVNPCNGAAGLDALQHQVIAFLDGMTNNVLPRDLSSILAL